MRRTILWIIVLLISTLVYSQERCGLHLHHDHTKAITFEKWLFGIKKTKTSRFSSDEIMTIPVVFHIIHNGEPTGEGVNIPDSRILEQVSIINQDFRRQNTDADITPSEFLDVAADVSIEFQLALQDPEGLPTTGITRTRGSLSDYSMQEDAQIKMVLKISQLNAN